MSLNLEAQNEQTGKKYKCRIEPPPGFSRNNDDERKLKVKLKVPASSNVSSSVETSVPTGIVSSSVIKNKIWIQPSSDLWKQFSKPHNNVQSVKILPKPTISTKDNHTNFNEAHSNQVNDPTKFTVSSSKTLPKEAVNRKTSTYQFTGNEKPFVPRSTMAKTTEASQIQGIDNCSTTAEQHRLSTQSEEWLNILLPTASSTPAQKTCTVPSKPIAAVLNIPLLSPVKDSNGVHLLQPVSPLSQRQMELEAGMKPSYLPGLHIHEDATQQTDPAKGRMRPILGRQNADGQSGSSQYIRDRTVYIEKMNPAVTPRQPGNLQATGLQKMYLPNERLRLSDGSARTEHLYDYRLRQMSSDVVTSSQQIKELQTHAPPAHSNHLLAKQDARFGGSDGEVPPAHSSSNLLRVFSTVNVRREPTTQTGRQVSEKPMDLRRKSSQSSLVDMKEKAENFTNQVRIIPQISPSNSDSNCIMKKNQSGSYAQMWSEMKPNASHERVTDPNHDNQSIINVGKFKHIPTDNGATYENQVKKWSSQRDTIDKDKQRTEPDNEEEKVELSAKRMKNIFDILDRECPSENLLDTCDHPEQVEDVGRHTVTSSESRNDDVRYENGYRAECSFVGEINTRNSSASTLPYSDHSTQLPDSTVHTSNEEDSFATNERDTPEANKDANLLIQGNAIAPKPDECIRELFPLETSDGLMDSVYEEDMVKGDSDIERKSSPSEAGTQPSFIMYGNNVWTEHSQSDRLASPEEELLVSESEDEGFKTCSMSFHYENAADSPVFDVEERNMPDQGYYYYSPPDTPTRTIKCVDEQGCNVDGLKIELMANFAQFVKRGFENRSTDSEKDVSFARLVLQTVEQMLLVSSKIQDIITHECDENDKKSSKVKSIMKLFLKSTVNNLNKIGSLYKHPSVSKTKQHGQVKKFRNQKPKKNGNASKGLKTNQVSDKLKPQELQRRNSSEVQPVKEDKEDSNAILQLQDASRASGTSETEVRGAHDSICNDVKKAIPIVGNKYWKKRMLKENLKCEKANSVEQTIRSNIREKIPERTPLFSTTFIDDDEISEPWTPCSSTFLSEASTEKSPDDEYTFYPYMKLKNENTQKKQTKGRPEKNDRMIKKNYNGQRSQDIKRESYAYRKIKTTQKNIKGNRNKNEKRKRSKSSPTNYSPTSIQTPKKTKTNDLTPEGTDSYGSRNRRHFPYLNQCNKVIDSVYNLRQSYMFREEYREHNEGPQDYYKVIKQPMFFEVITSNLRNRVYKDLDQFVSHVRRVFWNTRYFYEKYRGETIERCRPLQNCKFVETFFEKKLRQTFPFMDFSHITGSPQPVRTKPSTRNEDCDASDIFSGKKARGVMRELWK